MKALNYNIVNIQAAARQVSNDEMHAVYILKKAISNLPSFQIKSIN
jgi:hypothetical protein